MLPSIFFFFFFKIIFLWKSCFECNFFHLKGKTTSIPLLAIHYGCQREGPSVGLFGKYEFVSFNIFLLMSAFINRALSKVVNYNSLTPQRRQKVGNKKNRISTNKKRRSLHLVSFINFLEIIHSNKPAGNARQMPQNTCGNKHNRKFSHNQTNNITYMRCLANLVGCDELQPLSPSNN